MCQQPIEVGDHQVRGVPEPEHAVKAGLKTAHRVELPAMTEVTEPFKPTRASSWLQQNAGVIHPCCNQCHYEEDVIVKGAALKTFDEVETVISVMNLTDELHTLYRGTRVGEAHVITKCGRVEGLFTCTPRYDDDSKNSEDEGWLPDGRVKYCPITTLQGRAAFRLPWVDMQGEGGEQDHSRSQPLTHQWRLRY